MADTLVKSYDSTLHCFSKLEKTKPQDLTITGRYALYYLTSVQALILELDLCLTQYQQGWCYFSAISLVSVMLSCKLYYPMKSGATKRAPYSIQQQAGKCYWLWFFTKRQIKGERNGINCQAVTEVKCFVCVHVCMREREKEGETKVLWELAESLPLRVLEGEKVHGLINFWNEKDLLVISLLPLTA